MESIVSKIISSFSGATQSFIDMARMMFEKVLIPISLVSILAVIFFILLGISKAKKQRDSEELEAHMGRLAVAVVIFVLISSFSVIFWGWL